jgi:apolipoprotein N-acyltransferase
MAALLAPFALGLRGVGPWAGLVLGWLGGSVFWAVSAWWAFNAFTDMLGWPLAGAAAGTAGFCLFQGLPYALFGLACGAMNRRGHPPGPLFCASLLTLLVFLRPPVCPGSMALGLYAWPLAIQVADLGGVHLVLFIVLLANWLAAEAVARWRRPRRAALSLLALAGLAAAVLGYGHWRLDALHRLVEAAQENDVITIRSIQPNIPIKGSEGIETAGPYAGVVGALVKTTEMAAGELPPADLVLWPEVPMDVSCDCEAFGLHGVDRAAAASGGPVAAACVEHDYGDNPVVHHEEHGENGRGVRVASRRIQARYNAVWLVGENECRLAYHKVELVPFGERTPFQDSWPWLKKTVGRELEYSPGPGPALIALEDGRRVQPLVCFESGFPYLAREGAAMGADAFANVSDDIWFDAAKASEFHLALALFRTVEQRRPLVRCTNNGFGAHVRATGEIVPGTVTPMNERTFRQAGLLCPQLRTVYSQLGDSWLWVLVAAAALPLLAALIAPRRRDRRL